MIDVLVVDDQNTSRQFLKIALESEPNFNVVGLAKNGKEAIQKAAQHRPDVIVMDIEMPVMDGLSATKIISETHKNTKILIFSLYDDDEYLSNAIEAGAKGYLYKNTPPKEIVNAIHSVNQGYFQLGPGLLERYLYRFSANAQKIKQMEFSQARTASLREANGKHDFAFSKIISDVSRLEKNIVLNRSLIYALFAFNFVVVFIYIVFA